MAPSATADHVVTKAGIATSKDGERHIPSSVRADGTVRKEIRVRPGYRPPEDVEVYKNKTADAWKNRGKAGVPGAEAVGTEASLAANKNAKRREARKKAAASKDGHDSTSIQAVEGEARVNGDDGERDGIIQEEDPGAEKAKEARKLSKKLRQARELKDKKDKGDALLPEQFEKVIRINELIRQLDKLGFNADGEMKTAGP